MTIGSIDRPVQFFDSVAQHGTDGEMTRLTELKVES